MGPCETCGAHVNHRETSPGVECPDSSMVVSWNVYAEVVNERDAYLENLTATQKRCSALIEEMRQMKAVLLAITSGSDEQ